MSAWDRDGSAVPRAAQGRSPAPAATPPIRTRFWQTVPVRIMLPVMLATSAVLVLATVQLGQALSDSAEAGRASQLARASTDIGTLGYQLAREYVVHNAVRRTGQVESPEVVEQERRTDEAVERFRAANHVVRTTAPQLGPVSDAADRAVAGLGSARAIIREAPDGAAEVRAFYDQMLRSVLALTDALPAQMSDQRLIVLSRSLALLAELHHLGSLQLDLVMRGLGQRQFAPGDPILLAEWVGGERKQADALANLSPAGERYRELVNGVSTAASIRQVILDGRGTPASLALDPAAWSQAQSQLLDGVWAIEQAVAQDLVTEADAAGAAARDRTYVVAGLSAGVIIFTVVGAVVMAVRLSRRLRRTRHAALTAARVELPGAIANVIAARDADGVRAALNESSQRVDSMLTTGADEIGELSAAFGAIHRQALRLAADQALMRMEVQAMFIALSRRGQTLVQRQIHLIDEFGRDEADPDALERLFALDHLAARMRRNEENLLVLAGGEPGRWITRPVALHDLLRAAAQEIEEYRRVDVAEAPAVAVASNVAGDAIHLLAELLENATSFSPPDSRVRIEAARTVEGLAIAVSDRGIGIPDSRVAEANERLAQPLALTSSLVGTMGLLVVARLAQRHGIHVRLDSTPAFGTTATVTIPDRLAIPLSMVDQLQPGRWLRDLGAGGPSELPPVAPAVTSLPRVSLPSAQSPGPDQGEPARFDQPAIGQPAYAANGDAGPLHQRSASPVAGWGVVGQPGATPMVPSQRTPPSYEYDPSSGYDPSPGYDPPSGYDPDQTVSIDRREPGEAPTFDEPDPGPLTPDPDAVRARLSSLASGIAAARQGDPAPPPVPQNR